MEINHDCAEPETHQTVHKELVATDFCVASRRQCRGGQKVALVNTTKTAADDQLACLFCSCGRRNNSPYQEVAVVKKENRKTQDCGYTNRCFG